MNSKLYNFFHFIAVILVTRSKLKWLRGSGFGNQLLSIERQIHLDKILLERPGKIIERRHTHAVDANRTVVADDGILPAAPKSILKKVTNIPIGVRGRKRAKSIPALAPIKKIRFQVNSKSSLAKDLILNRVNQEDVDEAIDVNNVRFGSIENLFTR